MQWTLDHWFELAATALLGVIAIEMGDFSSVAQRYVAPRRNSGR